MAINKLSSSCWVGWPSRTWLVCGAFCCTPEECTCPRSGPASERIQGPNVGLQCRNCSLQVRLEGTLCPRLDHLEPFSDHLRNLLVGLSTAKTASKTEMAMRTLLVFSLTPTQSPRWGMMKRYPYLHRLMWAHGRMTGTQTQQASI